MEKVLLRNIEVEDSHKLSVYRSRRGYAAVEKVLKEMTPETRQLAYGLMEMMAQGGTATAEWEEASARMDKAIAG